MTDRMPPMPDAEMTDAQREAVQDYKDTRKTDEFEGPFVPLLRSPELLRHAQRVGEYLRYRSALPPRLSELAILVTARHWSQSYEWGIHAPIAAKAGVSAAVIEAIEQGDTPTDLDEDQMALYGLCRELLDTRQVSEPTYALAFDRFGERGVIDLVGILGYYSLLAMTMNATRTALSPGMQELPKFR